MYLAVVPEDLFCPPVHWFLKICSVLCTVVPEELGT
jgi:hypothetical protein